MRRVVVTGLGLVTPLGADVETSWRNIVAGKSGAGPITHFDASDQKCRIACEVKPAYHEYGFDPSLRVDHKVQLQVDPFIIYGIDAAGQAVEDAGLTEMDEATKYRALLPTRLPPGSRRARFEPLIAAPEPRLRASMPSQHSARANHSARPPPTGICPGPILIASATSWGWTSWRDTAMFSPPRAAPAPFMPWQAAHAFV